MAPGENVEVEAGDSHDGVVSVLLPRHSELGEFVPYVGEVVIRGVHVAQKRRGGGEEGDVLDIWVVFGGVCDEVVDVVAALPPADGEATAEVGDEHTDEGVGDEVVGDAAVTGVVGGEHDLVLFEALDVGWMGWGVDGLAYPEKTEERGRGYVPSRAEGDEKDGEESGISNSFFCVLEVSAVVKAFILNPLV